MRAVFAVLAACLILLSLTGGAAANVAAPCEPPTSEMLLHFDGDADEVPSCPVNGAAHHHHASCSGDHFAATPDAGRIAPVTALRERVAMSRDFLPPGQEPGSELDPPRA